MVAISRLYDGDSTLEVMSGTDKRLLKVGEVTAGAGSMFMQLTLGY